MKLKNEVYDVLKWVDLTFIPALITFYGILGSTLDIPFVQETLTIMGGFDVFLGALIGISSVQHNKKVKKNGITEIESEETED